MSEAVGLLQRLGFSEYEARAYVALLQRSPLNGYELAKASGIPRPNVYLVLQKLEERSAVMRVDTASGTRYAAVPAEELLRRLGNEFTATVSAARRALYESSQPAEYEYVWNMRGYTALLEHARGLVEGSERWLLLAVWPNEARALAESMAQAEARGIEVTTLCLAACKEECGGCRGRIHRYEVPPARASRWLVIVPDGAEMLAGEIAPQGETLAVRTRQRLFVELARWYIRHSITVASLLAELGEHWTTLFSPETRAMLQGSGTGGWHDGWQGYLETLVRSERWAQEPRTEGDNGPVAL